jgi:hypothetical protein
MVIGVDGVSDFNALHSGKQMRYSSARSMCSRWTATILDALPRLRPLPDRSRGPDQVSRERRGRALTEAVDLFPLRTNRCRETIQGVLGAEPRVHKDRDGRATRQSCPGCMAMKDGHRMPYKNLRNSASRLSASD